jgi:hypothetical protein
MNEMVGWFSYADRRDQRIMSEYGASTGKRCRASLKGNPKSSGAPTFVADYNRRRYHESIAIDTVSKTISGSQNAT